jgi:hypothetical protein
VAASTERKQVVLLDRNGTILATRAAAGTVRALAIARDGRTLVSGGDDLAVTAFDAGLPVVTERTVQETPMHPAVTTPVPVTPGETGTTASAPVLPGTALIACTLVMAAMQRRR